MTFFGALYKLLIGPLELFFEIVFVISNEVVGNLGLSIIVLSLVMNFLVLPLYKRADAMQEEQRETENKLKKWVTHIKKNFKGDERFMMLQTYYRQNNYKPTSILRGSVSLLLEIPFFIAAYNFLSHAGVFDGFAFGPFADMGKPDGLIKIAGLSINLLPILMTAINIVSSAIYTKGLPTSSKVQLYGMAGIFLILLYNSPACLVFYWTLNNLFSLLKNLFYKMKNPGLVLRIMASVAGIFALIFILFIKPLSSNKAQVFVICLSIVLQIPIIMELLKKKIKTNQKVELTKTDKRIFYLGVIILALLTGILIPSSVISSSPEEFINTITYSNPLNYVLNSALIAIGTFVVWFSIFYMLMDDKSKKFMGLIVWILSFVAIIDYMCFGRNLGTLSSYLIFDKLPEWSVKEYLFNLLIIVLIMAGAIVLWLKKADIINIVYSAVIVGIVCMSVYNCVRVNTVITNKSSNLIENKKEKPCFTLSKNGKNVIVMMMDRAISGYIPYIFNEKPDIAKQFEGFTYYPNTISFGPFTNFGAPELYGGYEYRPEEMNKRDSELLKDKHNESLKVMPVIFDSNDFDVTVFDPTYAGYDWIPDLTIYDEYPDIKKYITMGNNSIGNSANEIESNKTMILNRNMFIYSLMKICPLVLQPTIYNRGKYCSLFEHHNQVIKNNYESQGLSSPFMRSYNVLKNFSSLTNIKEDGNTFLMMSNDTTHEPCLLQEPEYEPKNIVDNTEYEMAHKDRFTLDGRTMKMDNINQITHYQVDVAALDLLGDYFDYLRENDLYNNTKIIIVADHGSNLHQFEDMVFGDKGWEDAMMFNPLFMVKDFNSKEFKVDEQFMTNADVPTLAFQDLINNPINPFTNKEISNDAKYTEKMNILFSYENDTKTNNGTTFIPGTWYSVHDNIFDINNWEQIAEP